jgi:tRNA modification GTPase
VELQVFYWPDHRSYTGQPSAELHLIGAPILLESLQSSLVGLGAQLAQPGEFTLRAFLAGRLDLTQCEAVLGVIHAANDQAFQVALTQLAGGLAGPLRALRRELIDLLADIEAGLDFVDEDIEFVTREQISTRLSHVHKEVDRLRHQMHSRAGQTFGLQVAIVGEPNAGKSSLINAIAGRSISIVSSEPGTTRDYVRCRIQLGGIEIDLLDTAGTETVDGTTARALAQEFTRAQVQHADLILHCVSQVQGGHDSQNPISTASHQIPTLDASWLSRPKTVWHVQTKSDLDSLSVVTEVCELPGDREHFFVSSLTGQGIPQLMRRLEQWAVHEIGKAGEVVPMTAQRCENSLRLATEAIEHAILANDDDAGNEIIAGEIRLALDELGIVAGTVYTDDILDALFSRFCIGK